MPDSILKDELQTIIFVIKVLVPAIGVLVTAIAALAWSLRSVTKALTESTAALNVIHQETLPNMQEKFDKQMEAERDTCHREHVELLGVQQKNHREVIDRFDRLQPQGAK